MGSHRINRLSLLTQAPFGLGAIVLAIWGGLPGLGIAGLTLLLISQLTSTLAVDTGSSHRARWLLAAMWVGTTLALGSATFAPGTQTWWDPYYAMVAWCCAASMLPGIARFNDSRRRTPYRSLILLWAFLGSVLYLGTAYLQNLTGAFHTGLLINVALLILVLVWLHPPAPVICVVNTLALLLLLLPAVDFLVRLRSGSETPDLSTQPYAYATGRADPTAFERWWQYYLQEWDRMAHAVFMPDPEGALPLRLRPDGHGQLFQSEIQINHQGFRGGMIPPKATNAYRIVALGESTTFGCTLRPEDRPWPDSLRELITAQVPTNRTIEVINAGVPAYTLEHNLHRLERDILPLEPDLIVSYHGYNGLGALWQSVPRGDIEPPPDYERRPLKLLADAEYRIRLMLHRSRLAASPQTASDEPQLVEPLHSGYGQAYRRLIEMTRSAGVRLAIANFSMAVDAQSDPDVVEFYRAGFPSIHWSIAANATHTEMLAALSREHPDILLIDTQPQLDGHTEQFIDLVHLTESGRRQLARNIATGLEPWLGELNDNGAPDARNPSHQSEGRVTEVQE